MEYTSGSTAFLTSFNHHKTESQRLMLNVYPDDEIYQGISVYGTVGIGIAKVKSSEWQGNTARQYASNTDTNLRILLVQESVMSLSTNLILT